jgi:hypothetical protein
MNTYTWQFPQLEAYPTVEDKTDVVFTVHWRLRGEDELENSAEVYGTVGLAPYDGEGQFVEFANLTKETVTTWVESALGEEQVASYKQNLDDQIEAIINPKTVTLTPPWN